MVRVLITKEMMERARLDACLSMEELQAYNPEKEYNDSSKYKRFEGRLGKEAFRAWLDANGYGYTMGLNLMGSDFGVNGYKLAVRTRTKKNHTRLIEEMTNFTRNVNDYYIGAHLRYSDNVVELYGYITREDFEPLTYDSHPWFQAHHTARNHQLTSRDISTLLKY